MIRQPPATGDPGDLSRLSDPGWLDSVRREARRPGRGPVRVADAKETEAGPAEQARRALLARIASGRSKIGFDFSNRAVSPARANEPSAQELLKKNDELRRQYTAYLDELSRTPAGLKLLGDLDRSKHPTAIRFDYQAGSGTISKGEHATDKKGEPTSVSLNPSQTKFEHRGASPPAWATERQKYGFYHELVHAWRITHGTQATGMHKDTRNSEWQATGLGPWAKDPISDNAIRRQMNKAERPEYGMVTY
jgi:hypothetical protein